MSTKTGAAVVALCASLMPAAAAAGATSQAAALDAVFLASAPPPPAPVAVCVVDTGVTPTPELSGALTARLNALGLPALDDAEPTLHGTLVGEAIAGRTVGIWPQAQIVSVRAWAGDSPQPFWRTYLEGIEECVRIGAPIKVINLSVADSPVDAHAASALTSAVADAWVHDMSVVVSAGNTYGAPPHTPADTPGAIAVAAADGSGSPCSYSALAAGLLSAPACPSVELAGVDGSPISVDGGTSIAAPEVSATLAALRAYGPALSRAQAEDIIQQTAVPGPAGTLRVDAAAAFRQAGLGALTVTAPAPSGAVAGSAPVATSTGAAPRALPRPRVVRRVMHAGALDLELARGPQGAHIRWSGATARRIGRFGLEFPLARRRRKASVFLAAAGRRRSPGLAISVPARRSAA